MKALSGFQRFINSVGFIKLWWCYNQMKSTKIYITINQVKHSKCLFHCYVYFSPQFRGQDQFLSPFLTAGEQFSLGSPPSTESGQLQTQGQTLHGGEAVRSNFYLPQLTCHSHRDTRTEMATLVNNQNRLKQVAKRKLIPFFLVLTIATQSYQGRVFAKRSI